MATTSATGSAGIDINSIVSQLMAVESKPLTALAKKEAALQAKSAAYGTVSGALTSFQNALKTLSDPERYRAVTATPGDATIVTGTATTKAAAGSYKVDVTQLASAQTINTAGQTSITAPIGTGVKTVLTIEFGSIEGGKLVDGVYTNDPAAAQPAPSFTLDPQRAAGSIVIDNTNNSLQGIRDAINKAGLGVTATIVSDGSSTPYHLVLTSDKTGKTSAMRLGVAGDGAELPDPALANLLTYNPAGTQKLTQTAAAADTKLTVNGMAISSATTTVEEAIQGVTLDVKKVGNSTLTIARDTDSVRSSVNAFVKQFNDLSTAIKSVSSYNAETKQAGLLLGDSAVRVIDSQVRAMVATNISGGNLTNLTQIGITFQKDGTLAVDDSKLSKALTTNFNDLAGLFASAGTASDSLVSFTGSSNSTKPGTSSLYISQLATQGKLVASAAPGTLTISADTNDQFGVTVDGLSATVKLPARTYTSATLASALQSAINSASEFSRAGVAVSVSADAGGVLTVQSNRYGSASKVAIGGNGAANVFGATPAVTDGLDVAGTINGVPATGSGQVLTGAGGTIADGMKLTILGGATGARGTVSFSQGFAQRLSAQIDGYIGSKGLITSQTDGVKASIKLLDKQQEALSARLTDTEKRLRAQYVALDRAMSGMGATQTYLTQQLNQIAKLSQSS